MCCISMWTLTAVGMCIFVINFACHGILFNIDDKEKIFTDTVLMNTIQIFSSMMLYVIMVEEINVLKFALYGCCTLMMEWVGFAFDYYSSELKLIKYYWTFSNTSLMLCIFSIVMLLANCVMTLEVVYFIISSVLIHYAVNGFLDRHVSQKIAIAYP